MARFSMLVGSAKVHDLEPEDGRESPSLITSGNDSGKNEKVGWESVGKTSDPKPSMAHPSGKPSLHPVLRHFAEKIP